jgi:replication factor A1
MESPLSKVEELRPCTHGYNLLLKVLSAKPVAVHKPRETGGFRQAQAPMRLAECIVGDDTGVVVFTARNEQGLSILIVWLLVSFPYYYATIDG